MPTPEERARENIDKQLEACGWIVQSRNSFNPYASLGAAVREFPLATGEADYLLFVDRKAVGVIEVKHEGVTLSGVAEQASQYSVGLPANIPHVALPLPFVYESTGVETFFRDGRDAEARSRRVFAFHRPETLAEWAAEPDTLHMRLCNISARTALITTGLWGAQMTNILVLGGNPNARRLAVAGGLNG